jgi:hypothetical protein
MKEKLTQSELKRQLHYDPDTGIFTWKVKKQRVNIGDVAGNLNKLSGYINIKLNGIQYKAHRLAWLYMEGYFPEHHIDHKFGIKDDNRWNKIKHVTRSCNMQNQKINSRNTSGFPGVSWHKRDQIWLSYIGLNDKLISLGAYDDPLEAALARFTFEEQCPQWKCNYRSKLVKAIKNAWPEFNFGKRRSR